LESGALVSFVTRICSMERTMMMLILLILLQLVRKSIVGLTEYPLHHKRWMDS
jgi:hypothetical protein